ncbi:ATP-binding protein [Castellaniella sp.]|uniref:ATP-binding protein n=1 Tax=Castellaniella sp. TaxID=1955812 RepID=UPI003566854B
MTATWTLEAVPGAIPPALSWLAATARQRRWPESVARHLALCLDEALGNIVMHGFKGQAHSEKKQIDLRILESPHSTAIDIIDHGVAFDPTQRDLPPLAGSLAGARPGGHGLRLMRHYLDEIHYERRNHRNHLRLIVHTASSGN